MFRRSRELKGDSTSSFSTEISVTGLSHSIADSDGQLDEGTIQDVESSLRDAISLNDEEARALLGRLEFQRGNAYAALQVLNGIDMNMVVPGLGMPTSRKKRHHKRKSKSDKPARETGLLFEAVYFKAKSLQKLGRLTEAIQVCESVLDTIEKTFPQGVPEVQRGGKLQETLNKIVELLPQLCKEAGLFQEAISAYRRALLGRWNLGPGYSGRLHLDFAMLLLYGGVEAKPFEGSHSQGLYVPKSNIEEAILLLLILLRWNTLQKVPLDHRIIDHLCFALSICGQFDVLAQQYEQVLPGTYTRTERWYNLALCFSGAGQSKVALGLLQKSLSQSQKPNDVPSLLLAAKLCTEDNKLGSEGVAYSLRAIDKADSNFEYLKARAYHLYGVCLRFHRRFALSDAGRMKLCEEALHALQEANRLEKDDPQIIMDLGLEYADQGNLNAALDCAKKYLELSSGASIKGWRFLALVLSAQKRHLEAETVVDAALDETEKWEQGLLLRTKAKLQIAQGKMMQAMETYKLLLTLIQTQRKSVGKTDAKRKTRNDKTSEVSVWQDLAAVYITLSQCHDAEICLEKAQALNPLSAVTWNSYGVLCESRQQMEEALNAYGNALILDPKNVQAKVSMGALLHSIGKDFLPVARSFLKDALHLEPGNYAAWYHLGIVHEEEGQLSEAVECFQASILLEKRSPVERFLPISDEDP